MKEVVIIGAGGHAKVIIDILLKNLNRKIIGILDDNYKNLGYDNIYGIEILGKISKIKELPQNYSYIIAIGNTEVRKRIAMEYPTLNYIKIVSSNAYIAEDVEIGIGSVVSHNAVINPGSRIGEHCIINTAAVIEHDVKVGDFSHVAPGAIICGGVSIGKATWIGARSVVKECIEIGSDCLIGAGSVVVREIKSGEKAFGTPARIKEKEL